MTSIHQSCCCIWQNDITWSIIMRTMQMPQRKSKAWLRCFMRLL